MIEYLYLRQPFDYWVLVRLYLIFALWAVLMNDGSLAVRTTGFGVCNSFVRLKQTVRLTLATDDY